MSLERLAQPLDNVAADLHALMPAGSAEEERWLVATGGFARLLLHGLRIAFGEAAPPGQIHNVATPHPNPGPPGL